MRLPSGFFLDKRYDLLRQLYRFLGIVRYAEFYKHLREAHDPESYLPVGFGHRLYLRERELVHVDDVIEKMYREFRRPAQLLPIDLRRSGIRRYHLREIYRSEVAALIRQERLFTARVSRLYDAQFRRWVGFVDPVYKYDAGFAVLPSPSYYHIEYLAGFKLAVRFLGMGRYKVVFFVALDLLHEFFGNGDRDVKIRYVPVGLFALYEVEDIGMVDAQYPHIRAAAGPALFDGMRGRVKDFHKRYRPARDTAGRLYHAVRRAQSRERKTGAAAGTMDQSGILYRLEYRLHRVLDR